MLRNEYLVAENRILRDQIKGRLQLSDAERQTLAEIGQKLGKQALEEVANIVKPDTITDRKCKRHFPPPRPLLARSAGGSPSTRRPPAAAARRKAWRG
jgi:putative transposase